VVAWGVVIVRLASRVVVALGTALGVVFLPTACVASDPDADLCAVGGIGCACTQGGACDAGLSCDAGTCVDPMATSTDAPVGSSEAGDSAASTTAAGASSDGGSTTDDTAPTAQPNVAFVTSTAFTAGALGGLAGADAICQDHADAAGLAGTYRAWLSLPGDDARDRIGDALGWIRPDGAPLAIDLPQIIEGRFFHPPVLDENGTFAAPNPIWTGTVGDGTANSLDAFGVCGGWTTDEPTGFAWIGDLGAGPGWWTAYASQPCTGSARLLCLGVDQQYELVVAPVPGRLAFVSAGYVAATEGRAAADALCQAEAAAAGDDGSFLALLAVPGEAPADRFDPDGAPWVRADGIPVFPDGAPFGDTLATPFVFDALGNPTGLAIGWAGSYGVNDLGDDLSSCTGWTANTGNAGMFATIHIFWQAWALGGGDQECAQLGYSVVCLEE
jgi:hypothetical protein